MSVQDIVHQAVRSALIKDGWQMTDDPLTIQFEDVRLFANLGAEKVITAQKGSEKIAVAV